MGRQLKRVDVNFSWPLNKVWEGYLNPHYRECPDCKAGYSEAYDLVAKHINPLIWCRDGSKNNDYRKITKALCGRDGVGLFGHDSLDAWSAIKKLGEIAGLKKEWTTCKKCNGSGIDPEIYEKYESWEEYEPPEGEGWQMWETTSEGSPMSPVCESAEDLAKWLSDNNASSFGADTASYSQWLNMINGSGWAMSAVSCGGKIQSGVEFIGTNN